MTSSGRFPQRLRSTPLRSSRTNQPPPPLEGQGNPPVLPSSSRKRPARGLVLDIIVESEVIGCTKIGSGVLQN